MSWIRFLYDDHVFNLGITIYFDIFWRHKGKNSVKKPVLILNWSKKEKLLFFKLFKKIFYILNNNNNNSDYD